MKALIYEGAQTLTLREVPDPVPEPGELLIKVGAVGICGSDMHAYLGHDPRRPAPLILGHEAAGTILSGPRAGARVTINPLVTCGSCNACRTGRENLCPTRQIISMPPREGAFAPLLRMPERNLIPIPDSADLSTAALAEPLAVSWHAARLALAALPLPPESALVLGGGAIGLGAALALAAIGTQNVTLIEPNPARAAYLRDKTGLTVQPEAQTPAPLVVDAVGLAATRASASALAEPGGVIVHIGLSEDHGGLDIRRMTLQEITFIGTYTYTAQDFRDTVTAMFDGRLGPLDWIETRPLQDGPRAFAALHAAQILPPKCILIPPT